MKTRYAALNTIGRMTAASRTSMSVNPASRGLSVLFSGMVRCTAALPLRRGRVCGLAAVDDGRHDAGGVRGDLHGVAAGNQVGERQGAEARLTVARHQRVAV